MAIINVDTADMLRAELQGGGTVLVDYGAPWCPPCKVLLPLLEELHQEYGNTVSILKVNCDDLPELAAEAGVMSMPTVIVFKEGQPMEKLVGLRPKSVYQGVLNKYAQAPSIL
ncbi:redoxin domain-containing protein [Paenibacillus sp. 19GGS1-52]|uniref:thioredoxin family protein n=1 Tax=Paenibacillus sp. 19GGS1-52 TaxID=2758563 RepID=UPI001EFB7F1F|nr:thioredoxin domain-containing protein [Paenibacillus sp. 19GGS1-52]ULO07024.1 redoxin domain-containing protein [Paenibacillus sp. 19GGS1-52]